MPRVAPVMHFQTCSSLKGPRKYKFEEETQYDLKYSNKT